MENYLTVTNFENEKKVEKILFPIKEENSRQQNICNKTYTEIFKRVHQDLEEYNSDSSCLISSEKLISLVIWIENEKEEED